MEKEGSREMVRLVVKHGGDIYSCGERRGDALEILTYYGIALYVDQHVENYLINRISERDRGGRTISNILGDVSGMYGVFFR